MDTVVDLMLEYFAAIDSGDDAAIEAAYQAWMAGRGEQPVKRLVAIGDAGGITAHTFADPIEEAHDRHIEAMREKRERRSGFNDWAWDELDPEGLGDDGEPFVTCEWQYNDDWHAEQQELVDYDASMDAGSGRI